MQRIGQWRSVSRGWEEKAKEPGTEKKKGRQGGSGDSNTKKLNTALLWRENERKEGRGKGSNGKAAVQNSPGTWLSLNNISYQFRPEKCQIKALKLLKDSGRRQGDHEGARDRSISYKLHFRNSRKKQGDIKISNMTSWISRKDGRKH